MLLPQSGRTVARSGLRMMPTFPLSPLSFRTAGFPQYGWKAGISDDAFPDCHQLKPAPGIRRWSPGLPSSFAHLVVSSVLPFCVGPTTRSCAASEWGVHSAPGALAPVWVILSQSISAYRPHPPHSRAHRDFVVYAAYTWCLRCAGAPRRPASGSGLSLSIPSRHAAPYVPGEIGILHIQFSSNSDIGLRRGLKRLGSPDSPAIRFRQGTVFRGLQVHIRYGLSGCSLLWTDLTRISPSHRSFYIQAFPELVTLLAAGYNYDSYWTSSVGGTLTHWKCQLASLHQTPPCRFPAAGSSNRTPRSRPGVRDPRW